jgi:hypothetical protein
MRLQPVLVLSACLAASLAAGACSKPASNTPEQAFEALRQAFVSEEWARLWDVVKPETQEFFVQQLEREEKSIEKQIEGVDPEEAAQRRMEFGVSLGEWRAMSTQEKFGLAFGGANAAVQLKLNRDEIVNSRVKETTVTGDRAQLLLDDGKGHRNRVWFVLVDGEWRYDPASGE